MTLVAIDVGNTSVAAAIYRNGRISHVSHSDGGFKEASRRIDAAIARLPAKSKPRGIAYASVVPAEDPKWKAFAKKRNLPLHAVSHSDFPLEAAPGRTVSLRYPHPETIGADRLADAAGAAARYGLPVLVMDFGTALTAAAVSERGEWSGGAIAPGFPLMRDYLFERTAKLPRMELGRGGVPRKISSTADAMRYGALVGYRGMATAIADGLCSMHKTEFRKIATGGFAKWALKDVRGEFTIDPDLTLFGTALVAERAFSRAKEVGK